MSVPSEAGGCDRERLTEVWLFAIKNGAPSGTYAMLHCQGPGPATTCSPFTKRGWSTKSPVYQAHYKTTRAYLKGCFWPPLTVLTEPDSNNKSYWETSERGGHSTKRDAAQRCKLQKSCIYTFIYITRTQPSTPVDTGGRARGGGREQLRQLQSLSARGAPSAPSAPTQSH